MSWILDSEVLAVISTTLIVASVTRVVQIMSSGRITEPLSRLEILKQK